MVDRATHTAVGEKSSQDQSEKLSRGLAIPSLCAILSVRLRHSTIEWRDAGRCVVVSRRGQCAQCHVARTIVSLIAKSWRTHFAAPELPFYFVQLSGISTLPTWGHFRDSQRRLGVLPRTYMTVSHDLGEAKNIHPKRKREIAERLVAAALVHEYGQTGVPSGPVYLGAELKSNKVLLHFQYGKGMRTSDGKAPKGFEVAGKNGAFVPAKARIVGETIEVWSDAVTQPQQVRYAWDSFPQTNVVGSNGFPISTFSDRVF